MLSLYRRVTGTCLQDLFYADQMNYADGHSMYGAILYVILKRSWFVCGIMAGGNLDMNISADSTSPDDY